MSAPDFVAAAAAIETSTAADALTINKPSGTDEGDIMVASVVTNGEDVTPPAGWTLVDDVSNAVALREFMFRKVAGGSEPDEYTFTTLNTPISGGICTYRGADTANPIDVVIADDDALATSDVVAPEATTTVDDARVIRAWACAVDSTVAPSVVMGVDLRYSVQSDVGSGRFGSAVGDHEQASAGVTGTSAATYAASPSRATAHTAALAPVLSAPTPAPSRRERVHVNWI